MNWTVDNIASQVGKTFLVTGANAGLGLATATILAAKGGRVIVACRNKQKGDEAIAKIKAAHPAADVTLDILDLGSLASVRAFAAGIIDREPHLDVLINNAGLSTPPFGHTADGFETQFGTNFLGPFALTGLLLPLLLKTPNARIVTLSSLAHRSAKLDFDNLNAEKGYAPYTAYGQSKLADLMFAYELQRRLANSGASAISIGVHPGVTKSNLGQGQPEHKINEFVMRYIAQQTELGALPSLMAAVEPSVSGGDYVGPGGFLKMRGLPTIQKSSARSYELEPASRLWEVAQKMTKVQYLN